MNEICCARYHPEGIQTILDSDNPTEGIDIFSCIEAGNVIAIRLLIHQGRVLTPIEKRFIVKRGWRADWIYLLLRVYRDNRCKYDAYDILTMIMYDELEDFFFTEYIFTIPKIENGVFDLLDKQQVAKAFQRIIGKGKSERQMRRVLESAIATEKYIIIECFLKDYGGDIINIAVKLNQTNVLKWLDSKDEIWCNLASISLLKPFYGYKNLHISHVIALAITTECWFMLEKCTCNVNNVNIIIKFARRLNKPNVIRWLAQINEQQNIFRDPRYYFDVKWTGSFEIKCALYELFRSNSRFQARLMHKFIRDAADLGRIDILERMAYKHICKMLYGIALTCASDEARKWLLNYVSQHEE